MRSSPSATAEGDDAGFTLVELLVTLLILTVVLVPSVTILSGSLTATAYVSQRQTAITLMDQQIERLRSLAPSSLASYTTPSPVTVDGTTYSYAYRSVAGSGGQVGEQWVQITVSWAASDRPGATTQVTDEELLCVVSAC